MTNNKVTRNEIIGWITGKQNISLIKAYRDITGLGLCDAKNAIFNHISYDDAILRTNPVYDFDGILNLFIPYLNHDIEDLKNRIDRGVRCALDNYLIFGFDNPFDAIKIVIENIRYQSN